MTVDSDLELMLRVRGGDSESFELLLLRHRAPLINYFLRLLRDPGLAEDLTQEVFLRVYQARHRYQPEAQFTTWLYRIATNLALNAIRDRKPRQTLCVTADDQDGVSPVERVADQRPTAEHSLMADDRQRIIREAVEALPEKQRTAVILHKYQEVDYRQIGKILNLSDSAVKSLLFRAYETLRCRLEPLLRGGHL